MLDQRGRRWPNNKTKLWNNVSCLPGNGRVDEGCAEAVAVVGGWRLLKHLNKTPRQKGWLNVGPIAETSGQHQVKV